MDRWAGRVAIVTGASSGIGARIAEDLVRQGLVVVGVARRQERLAELAARLAGARGKFHALQADLSKSAEVLRMFKWVDDNLGGVSVLLNNAAIMTNNTIQDTDVAQIESIVSTNLTTVMICARQAITSMQKHNIKDGHIININSVAGHVVLNPPDGVTSVSVYAATKHATRALSKGLRFDVQKIPGFKIRITSLSPGVVLTEMVTEEFLEKLPYPSMALQTQNISDGVMYALSCPDNVEITELTIQPTGEAF